MHTLDKLNVWMEYRLKNFGKQKKQILRYFPYERDIEDWILHSMHSCTVESSKFWKRRPIV